MLMSFDIFLVRFEDGKPADVDRGPVLRVLEAQQFVEPHNDENFDVRFPDGTHIEFSAQGLKSSKKFDGCSFAIRRMSKSGIKFMFDVAKAGNMVMFPAMQGNPCIIVDRVQQLHLPHDLNFEIVACMSAEELEQLLSGGYQLWRNYLEGIIRNTADEARR
jgi:hypothetical protein